MKRKILGTFLLALLVFVSCQEKKQEKGALVYKTMKVERTSQAVKANYSATMKGKEIVEIRPQVSGLITKILIAEGQKVHKGQALFVIDQVPYLEALNTAEAALKSAKAAEATAQLIDKETQKMIAQQYQRAKDILSQHTEGHAQLAQLLVEREVIFAEDVERIFGPRPWSSRTEELLSEEGGVKSDGSSR